METTTVSLSVTNVLLITFIVLKIIGVINWSWWLVLIPLWINIGIVLLSILIVAIVAIIKYLR